MGKRERRRRRERLLPQPVLTPPLPHRHGPRAAEALGRTMSRRLAELIAQQTEIDRAVDDEIDRLVALGVGWPVIACALGVTRQAARQRWLRRQL